MRALAILVLLCLGARAAAAEDLEDKGFGLRFTAALNRFSRYPDSAGIGGTGGGSPWSSSPNPASGGMNAPVGPRHLGFSVQYSQAAFEEGTVVHVASLSGATDAGGWGTWQPALVAAKTNRATTSEGLTFDWEASGGELQWARKVSCCTSVGVNLNVLASEMEFDLDSTPVSDSRSTTYGVRVGVLHEFSKHFFAGVAVEYSAAPSKTTLHDFKGSGSGDVQEKDTTHGITVRPGIYTFLSKDLTAYVDYHFSRFDDETGSLSTHRFSAGLDLTVIEGIYARGGVVLDHWGNTSLTAGIGVAPSERFMIDLSYQHDLFPELEPEFGSADVFGIGVTILF